MSQTGCPGANKAALSDSNCASVPSVVKDGVNNQLDPALMSTGRVRRERESAERHVLTVGAAYLESHAHSLTQ